MRLLAAIMKRGALSLKNLMMDGLKEGLEEYEGKEVYVKLKTNRHYSGKILKIEKHGEDFLLTLMDKFGFHVSFLSSQISYIEEKSYKLKGGMKYDRI